MRSLSKLSILAPVVALIALSLACQGPKAQTGPGNPTPGIVAPSVERPGAGPIPIGTYPITPSGDTSGAGQPSIGAYPRSEALTYVSGTSQQSGIWVTGTGKVTAQPDLALLNLGVEARASTVSGARQQAAEAMSRVVQAIKASGLQDKDIQTRYFNIQPQYARNDFAKKREITGYLVSNNVTAKVRNLDALGTLIDKTVEAGGDLIRVQGISFTVEEPTRYQSQAREAAVKDAMATAQQFATLTGVSLGKPLYIAQVGGVSPVLRDFSRLELEAGIAATPAPTTPISAGELDVQVQVQIVFDIK